MNMPDLWGQAAILVKILLYIGALGGAGLVMVRIVFSDLTAALSRRLHKQTFALGALALLASGLSFMIQGAALTGEASGMLEPEILGLMWQTPVGDVLLYRLAGAILLIFGAFIPRVGNYTSLSGGLLLLWSFAQIGHVPELSQTSVRLLLLLHLIGISFWIGILPPLYHLSCRPEYLAQTATLGQGFGHIATFAVPILFLAGGVMGWMLLGEFSALYNTDYGLTLLVKIALVGGLLGLAGANKLRFVPAIKAGDASAARHLARSIQFEAGIILAILAATATLTSVLSLPG